MFKTLVALVFLLSAIVFNLFTLSIINDFVPLQIKSPLPDIALTLLPKNANAIYVAEAIICFHYGILIGTTVWTNSKSAFKWSLVRRYLVIDAIMKFYRGIYTPLTIFPLADQDFHCAPQAFNSTLSIFQYSNILYEATLTQLGGAGLASTGYATYCGDYLFSGHSAVAILTYLFLNEYYIKHVQCSIRRFIINACFLITTAIAIVSMLVARSHYCIDIVIAYFVSTYIFKVYHTIIENNLHKQSSNKHFQSLWWWHILMYFEIGT